MSILITGATGYIGSHLTEALIKQGEKIRVFCRTKPVHSLFEHPSIEIILGDLNDVHCLNKAMNDVQQVYHLAAYARLWAKDAHTFYRVNVEGTKNVFNAAINAQVEKIVYTSTAGVIGPSHKVPMHEDMPRTVPFFNAYEETKTQAERVAHEFVEKGLNITIVNPARVYGPGLDCGSNPVTKIIELYLRGKWRFIPGNGEDIGSYCFIDDVVKGHIAAMEKGRKGERYIFGGINTSFNDFIQFISDISKLDYRMFYLPFPMLKAISHLMNFWSNISDIPPMITPQWVKRYDYDWALNSDKAIKELGYQIMPLHEGLKRTIEWLKENRIERML